MHIIPAIDIFEGKCVRLAEGDFATRKEYDVTPRAKAEEFLAAGARRLHVVDLEGAKEGRVVNWEALRELFTVTGLDIQVGGGVRSEADIATLLEFGAARVVVGSMAVSNPALVKTWFGQFGAERFCIALDIRDGALATRGWQDSDPVDLDSVITTMAEAGARDFLSTDIRRDGMLAGPNFAMYAGLVTRFPALRWIASGGVSSVNDIETLRPTGVFGAVIGKALYEHHVHLSDLFGSNAHP